MSQREGRTVTGWRAVVIAVTVALGALIVVSTVSRGMNGSRRADTSNATPAQKLASIQTGDSASPNDALVMRLQDAIDRVQETCAASDAQIAGYALSAHDQLETSDIQEDYLTVLRRVGRLIPSGRARVVCSEFFTLYVMARKKG